MPAPVVPATDAGVAVLPATDRRLVWRAVSKIVQAVGASLLAIAGICVAFADTWPTIKDLLPPKLIPFGTVVWAIGLIVEAIQKSKDAKAPRAQVNFSDGGSA